MNIFEGKSAVVFLIVFLIVCILGFIGLDWWKENSPETWPGNGRLIQKILYTPIILGGAWLGWLAMKGTLKLYLMLNKGRLKKYEDIDD